MSGFLCQVGEGVDGPRPCEGLSVCQPVLSVLLTVLPSCLTTRHRLAGCPALNGLSPFIPSLRSSFHLEGAPLPHTRED